jgi:putative transposase
MPRIARIVVPNIVYHITQRGNNRQDIFFVDDDRRAYLRFLKKQAEKYGLAVLGYCLMTNHVHIVAIPSSEESLAKAIGRTNVLFSQYINRLHRRSGHLWQGRFYSCALDEDYFWRTIRYIERNPVRAKLVKHAWLYPWSSSSAHIGGKDDFDVLDRDRWSKLIGKSDWKNLLTEPEDEIEIHSIRRSVNTGRPLGTDSFISKMEHHLGRRLRANPVGRPKNKNAKNRKNPKQKGLLTRIRG